MAVKTKLQQWPILTKSYHTNWALEMLLLLVTALASLTDVDLYLGLVREMFCIVYSLTNSHVYMPLHAVKQHITDCLCCWTDGTDGRARLGVYEGGNLSSVCPDEAVRSASVDGVVEIWARVEPTAVQNCVKLQIKP